MNPYVLSRYLARAPFGQGWIISIDNMEDFIGGHNRVSLLTNIAAQWHIITKPSQFITRAFTWSGEAYLSNGFQESKDPDRHHASGSFDKNRL